MKMFIKDDIFIKKMIEDTYKNLPESESSKGPGDLFNYFIKQSGPINDEFQSLQDLFEKHKINVYCLEYVDTISCFRTNICGTILDLPINWSIFCELNKLLKNKLKFVYMLNEKIDRDFLSEILGAFFSYKSYKLFIGHEKCLYLVYLPLEKKDLVSIIKEILNIDCIENCSES